METNDVDIIKNLAKGWDENRMEQAILSGRGWVVDLVEDYLRLSAKGYTDVEIEKIWKQDLSRSH